MKLKISDFKGTWALVTGASSGIGREFAQQLAAEGINIVLVARREQRLQTLATELINRHGIHCLALPIDLSNKGASGDIAKQLAIQNIKIRILVNNAGSGHWGTFEKAPEGFYESMVTLNVAAPMALAHAFFNDLSSFPSSLVINVSSPAVFQPVPFMAGYAASKAALHSFSLALSEEWKQFGVQLQTLVPGPTESEFDARAGAYECGLGTRRDKPADVVRASINALPSGKIMVCVAKGTMGQRIFGALFPPAFVVKKVAEMFRPKPG